MRKNVSLYIHIPFCLSKCSYCDFFSVKTETSVPDLYVDALCKEMEFRIKEFDVGSFKTLFIGGGTPSLLTEFQLKKIIAVIERKMEPDAEITIEVNPDDISREFLKSCKSCGINRISCGIQSLNEKSLAFVKRRASLEQTKNALKLLRKYWTEKLSVDLICGLPYETSHSFKNGLTEIISMNPDHISMYSLVLEDETPLGQYYSKNEYDFDFADELWISGRDFLVENGYEHYEVSNFCKPGCECRHNLVYWNHQDYIGCGCGGTGSVYYDDGTGLRITNTTDIEKYCDFWNSDEIKEEIPQVAENVSLNDSKYDFFMMGLRKKTGVSGLQFKEIFKTEIPENIVSIFNKWSEKGLCNITANSSNVFYSLNSEGILYLNRFLQELEL